MTVCNRCSKEAFHLGDIVHYYGQYWEVAALSCMKKLDDGEPEWQIHKKIQEVGLVNPAKGVTYQKPLWVDAELLLSVTKDP